MLFDFKVQIRETALEMILRALNHHEDHEEILQSGCRTLSNLTATLQVTLESWLDIRKLDKSSPFFPVPIISLSCKLSKNYEISNLHCSIINAKMM